MSTSIDTNQELHAIARGIAEAMPGWQYAGEQPHEHRAYLNGPDGASLHLRWTKTSDRLRIGGRWPKPIQYGTRYFDPRYEPIATTVAAGRAIDSIAKSIRQRLLPKYLEQWQEAVKARDAKLAEWEKLSKMLARLIEIPGVQEDREKGSVRFGSYSMLYGSAEVHSDGTATLTVHNLPFDVACAVLEGVLR